MKVKTRNSRDLFVVLLLTFTGLVYNWERLNEYPANIHAWAQADRYALALGYLDNGFDFFHPQTFVLNKQFPGNFNIPYESPVTSVDFPVHDYMAALLMKIFNTRAPWCFRFYTLIYSLIGLFFLYKLARLWGITFGISLFLTIFAASSPVFAWYQAGFLPTIPSLANAIIGIYLYSVYLQTKQLPNFYWSVFFLSLATLSRTTFFLAFSSLMAFEFLSFLKSRKINWFKIFSFAAGLTAIVFYYFFNNYLRNRYGSMFMNRLLPPENFKEALDILSLSLDHWLFNYFTETHYVILSIILFALVLGFRYRWFVSIPMVPKHSPGFIWFIFIYLLACLCFLIALIRQFPDHDYYFLDSFYLPVILFLVYTFSKFRLQSTIKTSFLPFLMVTFMVALFLNTKVTDNSRRKSGYWDRTALCIKNFSTGRSFLDSIGIAKNARLLIVDAPAPNLPFVILQHQGYNSMGVSEAFFEHSKSWPYDYLVAQTEFILSDIYKKYPAFITHFQKIADNGYLTIFKKRNVPLTQSLEDFLGLDSSGQIFVDSIDFDTAYGTNWENDQKSKGYVRSGNYSGFLPKEKEFGLTFRLDNPGILKQRSSVLKLSGWFVLPDKTASACNLVTSVNSDGQNSYYQSIEIGTDGKDSGIWQYRVFYFLLPKFSAHQNELSVYFWNSGKTEIFYDDLLIEQF